MPKLHGRVAVVTGASRGAGRAVALVLGQEGATVYVTGRSSRGGPTTDDMRKPVELVCSCRVGSGRVGFPG